MRGTSAPSDLPDAYAGTMFSTIRQRFKLNMVRLMVTEANLPQAKELVRRAIELERFVILGADF